MYDYFFWIVVLIAVLFVIAFLLIQFHIKRMEREMIKKKPADAVVVGTRTKLPPVDNDFGSKC
ncbi:MAG TPA: hypothetical protein VNK70_03330 [Candidatus Paceibacterota bacterium]|nr:hypothetical protein [Candidatus Paceibacterota bacterium]